MSQGTRQSERAAAEAKAGTTDSGRMPELGERPRICSTSGPAWEQEARKAAGAWREAKRKLRPPRLLGRVALSQDQSDMGPPRMDSRVSRMARSKAAVELWR